MKRIALVLLASLFFGAAVLPASITEKKSPPPAAGKTPGLELATMLSQVTGIAISPLLGVSCVGAYQYFSAHTEEAKAKLPWFAQVSFWLPALLLVGVCAFKDSFAALVPPGLKKPLDVAEVLENKVSGLVAAGAVVPSLVAVASKYIVHNSSAAHGVALPPNLAMLPLASFDFSWVLTILMVPLSIAVFAVVWVVGHAINVLILLSPWGGIDTALKAMRTALLSLVAATAYIDPVVGATVSAAIIIVAYFVSGWSFRLMVFGSIFAWDFCTLRRHRFHPAANGNKLFTGRAIAGAPTRTYGRLERQPDGRLLFRYRPLLVLAERTVEIPRDGLTVGHGLFFSEVLGLDREAGSNRTLLLLPPRYRGHEAELAQVYQITGRCDIGLRRAWSWLKEAFVGRPAPAAATA